MLTAKQGKISQNMYPPDHPMARGHAGSSNDLSRELWGDDKYKRTMAGDIDTGLVWSRQDEEDMAYGKDYSIADVVGEADHMKGQEKEDEILILCAIDS
ncbi:hypothetical protein MRB53_039181 [Persea americana]|nr:hypothetical protein MRB53_039181 [Persea americana]